MSAESTKNTLARHWLMLKCLPSRPPGLTSKELADLLEREGYKVTKRTVERDLNALSLSFPIACNDKSMPYGWYWAKGAVFDIPGLSVSEALSLKLVENYLQPLLPETILKILQSKFDQANQHLNVHSDTNAVARWASKVRAVAPALPMHAPVVSQETLQAVQQALIQDRQLSTGYRRLADEKVSELRLHPLALIQRGLVTYLVATAFEYADVRLYALHRMQSASLLDEQLVRPQDFDIDVFIQHGGMSFGASERIRLELLIDADVAQLLRETPLAADMTLVPEGQKYKVAATLFDTWQLKWWILSFADKVEVLSPIELRCDVSASLTRAVEVYREHK